MITILSAVDQKLITLNFYSPLTYIDLFIASFLIVGFFVYLHRFPVFRVVLGTFFLIVASYIFYKINFIFTSLVFGLASSLIVVTLPLIFAPEIRHYLEKLGRLPFLHIPRLTDKQRKGLLERNLVESVFDLADKKVGSTIVIARRTGLGQTIETGISMDAKFSSKLLHSIFFPNSPLHDGAVVIDGDRVVAANCLLPITGETKLSPPFGTRHSAAVGITQDTDALVLITSEERGEVSLALNGKLEANLDKEELSKRLIRLL